MEPGQLLVKDVSGRGNDKGKAQKEKCVLLVQ